jgi:type III secretory pathway component EscS
MMKQLGRPLPIRVEFRRQLTRKRTLVAFLLILALPLIVVASVMGILTSLV